MTYQGIDQAGALVAAIIGRLKADAGVRAVLGDPARVWDVEPAEPGWPHMRIGPVESRPVRALGGGEEHRITLTVVSKFNGAEECRAVMAAARACLDDARPEAAGVRVVSLTTLTSETFRAKDFRRHHGVMRLRAVTEESG